MSKFSRDKGNRTERKLVQQLRDAGLNADRVPLSGASWLKGDILTWFDGQNRTLEVKCRATGFRQLYAWLADNYALIIKADRAEPLIVLPLREALRVAKKLHGRGGTA